MVCTFFGHSNCPKELEFILQSTIIDLIKNKGVNKFYIGTHGGFDAMVHKVLKELSKIYPIDYAVVLAYLPGKKCIPEYKSPDDTILPDGIEKVPPKFAIDWRNKWMINLSNYVITYVKYSCGGAAKFKAIAEHKNKIVINIAP